MNTGALQPFVWRQLSTPLPYSPPNTNAAFFIEGITRTHRALFKRSSGIPLSGASLSSLMTFADSFSSLTSFSDIAANAELAISPSAQEITAVFILIPPVVLEVSKLDAPGEPIFARAVAVLVITMNGGVSSPDGLIWHHP